MAPSHKLSSRQCRWYLGWSVMSLSPGILLCQPIADDLALCYYFQCFSELCPCIDSHADNRPIVWWCHTLLLILHDYDCVLDTCLDTSLLISVTRWSLSATTNLAFVLCDASLSLSLSLYLTTDTNTCVISCQAQHQIIWTTSTSASITDFCNPALVSHLGDGQRHNLFCDTLEKLLVQPFLYMIISPKVNVSSLLLAHVTYHVTTGLFHHSLNLH